MTKRAIMWFSISIAALCGSPVPAAAQQGMAWLYSLQGPPVAPPGGFSLVMGIASKVASPSAAIFGHMPEAGAMGEFASTQAVISVGEEVPLPSYSDGTKAQDSEVFWTAQLWKAEFPITDIITLRHANYAFGDQAVATFSGRQLVSAEAHINGAILVPQIHDFQVLVNAFAFRVHDHRRIKSSSLTPQQPHSIGSIKAAYR